MENSYGIGVTNRYALFLDDESDPLETLKLKEQEKEAKKKNKVAEKENKAKVEVPAKGKQNVNQKKQPREAPKAQETNREGFEGKQNHQKPNNEGKPERNFNKSAENREERNNRRNREDRQLNGNFENNRDREDRPPRRDGENFENRRGGRGAPGNKTGGGGRGGRGRFNNDDRRGKREFDRQSGSDKTGIKPVDKRDGAGAHNWGSHKDIIEEADKSTTEADQSWGEVEKQEPAVTTTETKEEPEAETTHVEEEPKELTLDEWKAQRAGRAKPTYNIRKAGEGEDPTQWKKMYELNKKKDEEEQDTDDEEYDASEYPQRVGRQKHILDIDFHFNDSRRTVSGRGRGGRGNRGGNRGRGERQGRFRGNDEQDVFLQADDRNETRNAPKVDDEHDFPSLGPKSA